MDEEAVDQLFGSNGEIENPPEDNWLAQLANQDEKAEVGLLIVKELGKVVDKMHNCEMVEICDEKCRHRCEHLHTT